MSLCTVRKCVGGFRILLSRLDASLVQADLRVVLLLLIGSVLSISGADAAKQTSVKSAWTLMVYMDADNSLETPQMRNVVEMLKVGSSENVRIVMLCDRSPKSEPKDQYTDLAIGGIPNWSGAKLLHVQKGRLKAVEDWGDTNMADSATLRRFLATSAQNFPAEHYGLIIADHGSG